MDSRLATPPAPSLVRTLVLTDLVGSTSLLERLGDAAAADLLARHDRLARDLLADHAGREIDKSDGFLLLFERPVAALRFALDYHAALAPLGLAARAGIHLGEVIVRENPPADVARGAKPLEVEGLAKPTAARVMALAAGGQTLLTRGAFDLARRAAADPGALPEGVEWRAHGPYAFAGIDEPIEVFEAGIAAAGAPLSPPANSAKAHRALRPGEEELLGWRPAPGQEVRRRPGWVLDRKLGEGGFGEVWLARHARTREQRVFKFCFAFERLRTLKRELTLFLLMREALGAREDIQRLYDLNFEEPPYFLEMDYTEGGDLADWAEARGGIATVPTAARLELVAQVATAAAAAHSLGILHKDIKPRNVLIDTSAGADRPRARLTDFGIGQLADKAILAQVQVAATGFTADTLEQTELSSRTGTRLYMAPELLAGRPPSIQSDVYALGVMLWQVVVGDLGAAITTDWRERARRAGADALLLEDVAACLAGEPGERLASAAELAARLRGLPARRRARRRRNLARAGAAAGVVLAALLAAAVGVIRREQARADLESGLRAAAERNERRAVAAEAEALAGRDAAEAARAEAEARRQEAERNLAIARAQGDGAFEMVDFVLRDLKTAMDEELSVERGITIPKKEEIAHAIAGRVAAPVVGYFESVPVEEVLRWPEELALARAEHMQTAGSQFSSLGRYEEAMRLTSRTLHLRESLLGAEDPAIGVTLLNFAYLTGERGDQDVALGMAWRALAISERAHGLDHSLTEHARAQLARALSQSGQHEAALRLTATELAIAECIGTTDQPRLERLTVAATNLGELLGLIGDAAAATPAFQQAVATSEELYGPDHPETGSALGKLGANLQARGELQRARPLLERALDITERALGPDHPRTWGTLGSLAALLGDMGEHDAAIPLARRALATSEKVMGADAPQTGALCNTVALLLQDAGRHAEALPPAERALRLAEQASPPNLETLATRLNNLGLLHIRMRQPEPAVPLLRRALALREEASGPDHPITATVLSNLGLALEHSGEVVAAAPLFERALDLRERLLGAEHPLTATSLNNLGALLDTQGNVAAAVPLLRRALSIREKVLGPEHPLTGLSANNLGDVLRRSGQAGEALPLLEHALRIGERTQGPDHLDVATTRTNLALALQDLGHLPEAQQQFARAAATFERGLGAQNERTAGALALLGNVAYRQRDYAGARPILERALGIRRDVLGPDHPATLDLARLTFAALARLARAEAPIESGGQQALNDEALGLLEGRLDDAGTSALVRALWAECAWRAGRGEEARPLVETLVAEGYPDIAKSVREEDKVAFAALCAALGFAPETAAGAPPAPEARAAATAGE